MTFNIMRSPKKCNKNENGNEIYGHFDDLLKFMKEQAELQSKKESNSSKGLDKFLLKKTNVINTINKNSSPKKISSSLKSFFNELSKILYGNGNNIKIKAIKEIFESLKKNNIIHKLNDLNSIKNQRQIRQNYAPSVISNKKSQELSSKLNKLEKNHLDIEKNMNRIQGKVSFNIKQLQTTIRELDKKIPDGELEKRIENVINREFNKIDLSKIIESEKKKEEEPVEEEPVEEEPVEEAPVEETPVEEAPVEEEKENIKLNIKYFEKVIPYENDKNKIIEKQNKLKKILHDNSDNLNN
tara:strand:- start:76 stop:969 length:894 start_codon:yes stop_codon:yes gene_type:complete